MSNPFKDLDSLEEEEGIKAPSSIKSKVLGSYGFMLSIGKVVEFIFGSFSNVLTGMVHLFENAPPSTPNIQHEIRTFGAFSNVNEKEEEENADENKNID